MEPEGSLPCLQEPSTGPCPESDQSSITPVIFIWDQLSSHLRQSLRIGLFPSLLPTKTLYAFFFFSHVC
jgi:hypothetical protein